VAELNSWFEQKKGSADFRAVYISEAHPTDGRQAVLALDRFGVLGRKVGDAVRHDRELVRLDALALLQDAPGGLGHDDEPVRARRHAVCRALLGRRRLEEHGVERRDYRKPEPLEQLEQVGACLAAKDAELVLDVEHVVRRLVQPVGERDLVFQDLLACLPHHLCRVCIAGPVAHRDHVHRDAFCPARFGQVPRERSDPALPRHEAAEHGHSERSAWLS
jgi:hypothetical protein